MQITKLKGSHAKRLGGGGGWGLDLVVFNVLLFWNSKGFLVCLRFEGDCCAKECRACGEVDDWLNTIKTIITIF